MNRAIANAVFLLGMGAWELFEKGGGVKVSVYVTGAIVLFGVINLHQDRKP